MMDEKKPNRTPEDAQKSSRGVRVMLSSRQKEQIIHLITVEHRGIREVSRMLGIDRNSVKRCLKRSNDLEPKRNRLSDLGEFLNNNKSVIVELFIKCEYRCPPLQRLIADQYSREVPLRMLQRFCNPIRSEMHIQKLQGDIPIRFETIPGCQMQIDFGEKDVLVNGQKTRLHIFVCKLCYSRRIFAKAYWSETQSAWLDGIESSFKYFGGIPYEIVCDNASSLVRDHYAEDEAQRFTENFYQLACYYKITPVATAVRKPRSKGKVESGVKYVKANLPGVDKPDLAAWNLWLEQFCRESDSRKLSSVFEGARTPAERWLLEQSKLRKNDRAPMGRRLFIEKRKVSDDGLIRVDNKYYRVPDTLVGRSVQVQIDDSVITVTYGNKVSIQLDKTAGVFNPLEQETSTPQTLAEEAFNKKFHEVTQDLLWQENVRCPNELAADAKQYDEAIGWVPDEQKTQNQEDNNGNPWHK